MQYTPEQLAAAAKTEATPNLCAITLMGNPAIAKAAQEEIEARRATCDWQQAQAIAQTYIAQQQAKIQEQQARQANAMALFGASALFLQQSGPRSYAPSPVNTTCVQQGVFMNCNSY